MIALIFICCALVGFIRNFQSAPDIPPQTTSQLTCGSPLSGNQQIFHVYLTELSIAEMALPLLCNNKVVQRQFGNVAITIGRNDFDTFRYINHGVPELTLVKSNVVLAFGADQIYHYDDIAAHPDYSAYFIALREKPRLNKEFLLGKRIGILDYPSSRSGHIVPKTVLQQLGLNDSNISLYYYNSHQELRVALLAGEVDIIASYWGKGDEDILSRNYITSLENSVPGMRWYLKMQTHNTDLRCALQQVIADISANHPRKYYRDVELIGDCATS
ncbi:PhnD/SsuA/transferrin family substrate-binding protein [Alteromonas sp. AMM-1]|uniref:PhnD/SsuA/transferrin family substrate-binding protein n=1 Tax=Alteromonas sp. AMM-1 TaxID=3394233 RepID=UPI0039A42C1B